MKSSHCLLACLLCGVALSCHALEFKVAMIQLERWTMPDPANPGQYIGIVPEVLREIEKRSGHTVRGYITPYARVEDDLERGVVDFSFMAWGPQRARYANKGAVGFPLQFGVWAIRGVPLKSYQDLQGLKISVTRGLKVEPQFDMDQHLDKAYDLDYTVGIHKAKLRRVHAVAGSRSTIRTIIVRQGLQEYFGDFLPLKTTDAAIAFSKKAPQLAHQTVIDTLIQQMVADGTMKKIAGKWLLE